MNVPKQLDKLVEHARGGGALLGEEAVIVAAEIDQLRILLHGVLASTRCIDEHDVAICPSITADMHLNKKMTPHG